MSLERIIRNDINKKDDAIKMVLGEINSSEFMKKYGVSRQTTAQYIRFYRTEIKEDTKPIVPSMYDEISYDNGVHRFHFAGMQHNSHSDDYALYTCGCGFTLSESILKVLQNE